MTTSVCSSYAGYCFPTEVISHAVWLYFRFPLSLRMVEEMLAARGIIVSHETVRQWARKFGRTSPTGSGVGCPAPETNDGVDAPPDGIAMCQGGDVFASHERRGHPWKRLALSVSILRSGPSRRMAPLPTAALGSAKSFPEKKFSASLPSSRAASSPWKPVGAHTTGGEPSGISGMRFD